MKLSDFNENIVFNIYNASFSGDSFDDFFGWNIWLNFDHLVSWFISKCKLYQYKLILLKNTNFYLIFFMLSKFFCFSDTGSKSNNFLLILN